MSILGNISNSTHNAGQVASEAAKNPPAANGAIGGINMRLQDHEERIRRLEALIRAGERTPSPVQGIGNTASGKAPDQAQGAVGGQAPGNLSGGGWR